MTDHLACLLRDTVDQALQGVVQPNVDAVARAGRRRRRARSALTASGAVAVTAALAVSTTALLDRTNAQSLAGPASDTVLIFVNPNPADRNGDRDSCATEAGAEYVRTDETGARRYAVAAVRAAPFARCLNEAVGLGAYGALDSQGRGVLGSPGWLPDRFTAANLRKQGLVAGTLRDVPGLQGVQAWLKSGEDSPHVCFGRPSGSICNTGIVPLIPGTLVGGTVATAARSGSIRITTADGAGVKVRTLPAGLVHWEQLPGVALVVAEWAEDVSVDERARAGMDFVPAD